MYTLDDGHATQEAQPRRRVLLDLTLALRRQAHRAEVDQRTGVPATEIVREAAAVMRFVAARLQALARE